MGIFLLIGSCQGPQVTFPEGNTPEESSRSGVWTGSPVRLLSARSTGTDVIIRVNAKPLGDPSLRFLKVHYKEGSQWVTSSPFLRVSTFPDVVTGIIHIPSSALEFVVKYETSQGTFWDNNAGNNYFVS